MTVGDAYALALAVLFAIAFLPAIVGRPRSRRPPIVDLSRFVHWLRSKRLSPAGR